jgi:hypothetical protein
VDKEVSLPTMIGAAVEAARGRAQEMGASPVKKAEGAASNAKPGTGKAWTLVRSKTRAVAFRSPHGRPPAGS